MIEKMSKYSMVLLTSGLDGFLRRVQDLGMMDITRSAGENDDTAKKMVDTSARYRNALSQLADFKKIRGKVQACDDNIPAGSLLEAVEQAFARAGEIARALIQTERDLEESRPWGDFNPDDLARVRDLGLDLHFYAVQEKKFKDSWKGDCPLQVLNAADGKVFFAVLSPKGAECPLGLAEQKFPEKPASVLASEIRALRAEEEALFCRIAGYAAREKELAERQCALFNALDCHLAKTATVKEGEGTISVLEGFARSSDDAEIRAFLDASDVLYMVTEAKTEDNPPVELKNNAFAKVFEPIGSLYMLPTYGEMDLTPFFAPFYMLFFGLCLGDMGYGLTLLAAGLAAALFLPGYRAYGKLVAWLGFGSILMPLLSGTFFGLKLPDIIPMSDTVRGLFFTDMKMFWFSIIFGLVQIVFARLLKAGFAFSNRDWDTGLTEVGWCLIVVWAACAYAGSMVGHALIPVVPGYVMAAAGLVLVLFCSKPSRHFLLRPLLGITSLYDITGIFGDMLSYIRLFGLGLTGGILALVINSVALSLSSVPYVGWVLTVLLLIVGHIAVMGLSCLGAFVHPVRLTFVEFYKNAGFVGGGRAFNPLRNHKF